MNKNTWKMIIESKGFYKTDLSWITLLFYWILVLMIFPILILVAFLTT